jgi:hypothetical protein
MAKTATATKTAPAFDAFGSAPIVAAPVTKAKTAVKASYEIEGLDELASINALMNTLKGLKESKEASIKQQIVSTYSNIASLTHNRPANFKGEDNHSSADCQIKRRDMRIEITSDQQDILKALSADLITKLGENVKTADQFYFNPEIMGNQVLMSKLSAAISPVIAKIPEFAGVAVILHQAEAKIAISSDDAIEAACKLPSKEQIEQAIDILCTPAIKTMLIAEKDEKGNDKDLLALAFSILKADGISLAPEEPKKAIAKK